MRTTFLVSLFCALVAVFLPLNTATNEQQLKERLSRKFLTPIEHIVVLMLENRSFDHYLGLLKNSRPDINGCLPTMSECTNPTNPDDPSSQVYPVTNAGVNVQASPSHSVHGTTTQIFGWSDPSTNRDTSNHTAYDYGKEDMKGFLRSYASVVGAEAGPTIMDCVDPSHVPVMSTLAEKYLLFDSWFASVPGPTEPNRCYAIAASSHGMSTNDVETMARGLPNKSLFRQLSELELDWRVYFELVPTTLMFKDMRHRDARSNYFRMGQFYKDVEAGNLPYYTWLEPNYYPTSRRPADDQHPDHSLADGELLIKNVYESLRGNEALWNKTALIITYDEHGGFFDHVPPPNPVPSPDGLIDTENDPFDFMRLGVRVPTLIASPWVRRSHLESAMPENVVSDREHEEDNQGAYEHSSLAATIAHKMVRVTVQENNKSGEHAERFIPFLSARDQWARTFDHVFKTMSEPRSSDDCPKTLPDPYFDARSSQKVGYKYTPVKLNDLQQDLLLILAGIEKSEKPASFVFNETDMRLNWTTDDALVYIKTVIGDYFPNAPLTDI